MSGYELVSYSGILIVIVFLFTCWALDLYTSIRYRNEINNRIKEQSEARDKTLLMIGKALDEYREKYKDAEPTYYRYNSVSVRIRIIDPSFAGLSKGKRSRRVWPYLRNLPKDVVEEITFLLLLTKEETEDSQANIVFQNKT